MVTFWTYAGESGTTLITYLSITGSCVNEIIEQHNFCKIDIKPQLHIHEFCHDRATIHTNLQIPVD